MKYKESKQIQLLKLQMFHLELDELKDIKATIEYLEKRFKLK